MSSGNYSLFTKQLHRLDVDIIYISTIRLLISWGSATLLMLRRPNPSPFANTKWWNLAWYGFIGVGLVSITYIASLKYTTVAISILTVFSVTPVTTYVIEKMYLNFKVRHVECLALITLGFVLLSYEKFQTGLDINGHLAGILLGVICGVCFGTYAPLAKKVQDVPVPVVLFWIFGIGFICHLPLLVLSDNIKIPLAAFPSLIALGTLGCFLPYLLIQLGMKSKSIGPVECSMLFMLEPVISVIVGIYFQEYLSIQNWVGVALVLGSVWLYKSNTPSINSMS